MSGKPANLIFSITLNNTSVDLWITTYYLFQDLFHLKITFIIAFLSGLICWDFLSFIGECEDISSFEVVPEYCLLTLGNIQLLGNHLSRDDKLTFNQSPSGLSNGTEMLFQRHKVLGCLDKVFSISATNVFDFFIRNFILLLCFTYQKAMC